MKEKLAIYARLFSYLKPHWREAVLAYGSTIAFVALSLYVPQLIKDAIDEGIAAGELTAVWQAALFIVLVSVVTGVMSFGQLLGGEWLTYRFSYDLRNELYNAVQYLPFSFHDTYHTGDVMSRATSDIGETERFVGVGTVGLISTFLLLMGVIGAMFWENAQLASLAMIPMLVLTAVAVRFGGVVRSKFMSLQVQLGAISKTMQESLTGINLVKAFSREGHELEKFDVDNGGWFDMRVDLIKTWSNNWPLMTLLVGISIFILLWWGGPLALDGRISVGTLFAMISYVLLLNGPVQRIGFLVNLAATAGAAATRVFEIIDMPNEVADTAEAIPLENVQGCVAFEDVSFGYHDDQRILHDINFSAQPGETVALIGPTGSGKSTVTNLLPRFYEVSDGRITVDGYDIRTVTMESLRGEIGMVLQDSFLFSNTIAENIAYGHPGAKMADIVTAAKAARAHDFIQRFPEGYKTLVGERGVTLSGGQKQRIAIARALLSDPSILILDDSTSSVDTETEYLIQQALQTLMEGRTTFVIAQRLLTLKNADQILVLDHGRVVERGQHDELLAQKGLYRQLYDLQLKDQEEMQAMAA